MNDKTMTLDKSMTFDEWIEKYRPIPFADHGDWSVDLYSVEKITAFKLSLMLKPGHLWTYCEYEGKAYFEPRLAPINAYTYFICENKEDNADLVVHINDL